MRNSIIILVFICFVSVFSVDKSIAQDSTLINTFNVLISKVDKGFSLDTNIDSVHIDSLNILYLMKGLYIDTINGDNSKYGKIYVLKYESNKFSIIDSTSRFMYDYYTLNFEAVEDTLFIHFEVKRTSNDYTYVFNKNLRIYQLVSFSTFFISTFNSSSRTLNSNFDIKKQLLSWEIIKDDGNKIYDKFGKKKIILHKDFPIQLRKFNMLYSKEGDSILIPPEW